MKAFAAALRPFYWGPLMRGVVPTIEHRTTLLALNPLTVIDVGANRGQFSIFSRFTWPDSKIIAFEPQPDQAETWKKLNIDNSHLIEIALGAKSSQAQLYIASRKDSSSLLPLGENQKTLFRMDEVGTINVDVKRLDQVLQPEDLTGPTLMKIDVQGFEYEVLEGATGLFPYIDFLYLELSVVELYVGQTLYNEVKAFLAGHGFEELRKNAEDNVQFDVVFRRKQATVK